MLIVVFFAIIHVLDVIIVQLLLLLCCWYWVAHFFNVVIDFWLFLFKGLTFCITFFYNLSLIFKFIDLFFWIKLIIIKWMSGMKIIIFDWLILIKHHTQWWKSVLKSETVWLLFKNKTSPACSSTHLPTQSRKESCQPQHGPYHIIKECLKPIQSDVP